MTISLDNSPAPKAIQDPVLLIRSQLARPEPDLDLLIAPNLVGFGWIGRSPRWARWVMADARPDFGDQCSRNGFGVYS